MRGRETSPPLRQRENGGASPPRRVVRRGNTQIDLPPPSQVDIVPGTVLPPPEATEAPPPLAPNDPNYLRVEELRTLNHEALRLLNQQELNRNLELQNQRLELQNKRLELQLQLALQQGSCHNTSTPSAPMVTVDRREVESQGSNPWNNLSAANETLVKVCFELFHCITFIN